MKHFYIFKNLIIAIIMVLAINVNSFAVDVYVGTATATTTSSLPVYSYGGVSSNGNYSYTQQIYLASEITSAGGSAGEITSIAFYLASGSFTASHNNWKVYIAHTSNTYFSTTSYISMASATEAFNGTLSATSVAGWITVNLSTPFTWDGTSNIVVGVIENSPSSSTSYAYFRYSATSDNKSIYTYGSTAYNASSSYTGTRTTSRPNIWLSITPGGSSGSCAGVQIGSATTYGGSVPTYTGFSSAAYSYSQIIYQKGDIGTSNAGKQIDKISFQWYSGAFSSHSWEISIGHTALSEFPTGGAFITGLQSCGTVTVSSPATQGNWLDITLPTPFTWNGTDNIVIAINKKTSFYTPTINWYYTSTTNSSCYTYSTASYSSIPGTGSRSIYRPNIKLCMSGEGIVLPPEPTGCNSGTQKGNSAVTLYCDGTNTNNQSSFIATEAIPYYVLVSLEAGQTYQFRDNANCPCYITITNTSGTILDHGEAPFNYTAATPSANYRVYVHSDDQCNNAYCGGSSYYGLTGKNISAIPSLATNPNPANGATNVPLDQTLSWTAASCAYKYDVYFGKSLPGSPTTTVTTTSYNPGPLDPDEEYCWKIVPKTYDGTATNGSVETWCFTTANPCAAPTIIDDPATDTYCFGDAITDLSVTPSAGTTPYTYQWQYHNGTNFVNVPSNGTSATYKPHITAAGTTTQYQVIVGSSCGSTPTVTSNAATITINPKPTAVAVSPSSGTFCEIKELTASNGGSGTIYWQNTTSNGTSTSLGGSPQTVTTSGTYYFRAYNGTCWSDQDSAIVTINYAPTITTQPTGLTFCQGAGSQILSVVAGGTPTLTYQWKKDGTNIATNSTSSSYTIPTSETTGGSYTCAITNTCSTTTTTPVTVTINNKPVCITTPSPADNATNVATTAILSWDAVANATEYEISFMSFGGGMPTIDNTTSTSYSPTLVPETTYVWRITPKNSCGGPAASCSDYIFKTAPLAPTCPTLLSPADEAEDVATNLTLSWASVSGATSYDVYLSSSQPLTSPIASVTVTSFTVLSVLDTATKYYWKIVPKNAGGEASNCDEWSFTTEEDCTIKFMIENALDVDGIFYSEEFELPSFGEAAQQWIGVWWEEALNGGIINVYIEDANNSELLAGPLSYTSSNADIDGGNCDEIVTIPLDLMDQDIKIRFDIYKGPSKSLYESPLVFNYGMIVQNINPLPITWLSFNGECKKENGESVLLNWSTASEISSDYYVIERSLLEENVNWEELGRVSAAGNSNTRNDYTYTDRNLNSVQNYYRLKQVDLDGNFNYSNIIHVACQNTNTGNQDIIIYPNPFDGKTLKIYSSSELKDIDIQLFDVTGRLINTCKVKCLSGIYDLDMNKRLEPGSYTIALKSKVSKIDIKQNLIVK